MTGVGAQTPVLHVKGQHHSPVDMSTVLPCTTQTFHSTEKHTSYVKGLIEGCEVTILMDTGSNVSLITDSFRMSIPSLRKRVLNRQYILARAVNGQLLDTLGTLLLSVNMGNEHWEQEVHVVREATQSVLLGWDFLHHHHAIIDIAQGVIHLRDIRIPLMRTTDFVPECCNVSVSTVVSILLVK